MIKTVPCLHCGRDVPFYANPKPTVDVVIYHPERGIVIIKRRNEPLGYALPGGFVDEGEQVESAALREMREETSLNVRLDGLLGVYSAPDRDPRGHTLGTVFVGTALNPDDLKAGDDAAAAEWRKLDDLPEPIVFDHGKIIQDFREALAGKRHLAPAQPFSSPEN